MKGQRQKIVQECKLHTVQGEEKSWFTKKRIWFTNINPIERERERKRVEIEVRWIWIEEKLEGNEE